MPTNWDDVAGDAAAQTDKELEAGLNKLMAADTAKLFPNPIDREKVNALIKTIRQETNYNKRAAAFKGIMVTIGADLAKVVKAAMLTLAVFFLIGAGRAMAQIEPITAIDLSAPLADARMGLAWNGSGKQLGVAYVPLMYWVGSEGQEYATLNLGTSDRLDTGKAGYLVSAGPRIDTLFVKLAGTKFAQKHLRFAILPPLQISISYVTSDFRTYEPFLTVCTRFGGK